MPIDFPASPSTNDIYSYAGKSWIWNGIAWQIRIAAFGLEHAATVSEDYTVVSTNNLISGGPLTVNNNITVTVESGATWTIV